MHLDEECLAIINSCFSKNFTTHNSSMPGNPWRSGSVAFLINKALIAPEKLETFTL